MNSTRKRNFIRNAFSSNVFILLKEKRMWNRIYSDFYFEILQEEFNWFVESKTIVSEWTPIYSCERWTVLCLVSSILPVEWSSCLSIENEVSLVLGRKVINHYSDWIYSHKSSNQTRRNFQYHDVIANSTVDVQSFGRIYRGSSEKSLIHSDRERITTYHVKEHMESYTWAKTVVFICNRVPKFLDIISDE